MKQENVRGHVALDEENVDKFIRFYNQAVMHKAPVLYFEGSEVPTFIAMAMITVIVGEKVIYGSFDDKGIFTKQFNPQLN